MARRLVGAAVAITLQGTDECDTTTLSAQRNCRYNRQTGVIHDDVQRCRLSGDMP